MRFFVVAATLRHLKKQGFIEEQMLTSLCVHSDNAAQHFKSSKSLHWLSKQLEGMGFTSVMCISAIYRPSGARQGISALYDYTGHM